MIKAYQDVEILCGTFHYTYKHNTEAFAEIEDMVNANAREQLAMILFSKTEILRKIIDDALAEDTKPRERLAIYKALDELSNSLSQNMITENWAWSEIHEMFKQGPVLKVAKSRFYGEQTTVSMEGET